MGKLTLNDIEKVIKEYEDSHPEGTITHLGDGLYKVGCNIICGEKFIEEINKIMLETIKK